MKKIIVALIAGAAAMSAAQAQNFTSQPRAYIGGSVVSAKNVQLDDHKTGGKLYGGYQLNPSWAIEAGYTDFGEHDVANGTSKGNGTYFAAKAIMPLDARLSLYGKLGMQHSEREYNSAALRLKDNDTGAYGALGLEYKLNQQVALTAEYERYGKEKDLGAKANVWSVGANYSF